MTAKPDIYRDRARAAVPTVAVHLLLALALMRGLGVELPEPQRIVMALIDLAPPPPQAVASPPLRERSRRPEGAASPPNFESQRTKIVAPPVMPLIPPPVVTAPVAGVGADPSAGSADVPGPGSGSGGEGDGTGSGGRGSGPGGGGDGDGGGFSPPRRIRGSIGDRDYPAGLGEAGIGGTVAVIYTVETDGRATNCRITGSSGHDALDDTTCRLIEQRFRFNPSRDRAGRPVRSRIVQDHYWESQDEPPEPERPARRRRW